ncbi:Protein of unknown function [Pyronema omphalodes CBS 100304]|uniref:Uncharacterized protein n=1 Tax=Pyronema omphalodes (strain CBS 100304) TaxID=1076935 RepID=U4LW48_PYROM|nr:Protein of unknown function [Pyronema omphalodes CBS 100304]
MAAPGVCSVPCSDDGSLCCSVDQHCAIWGQQCGAGGRDGWPPGGSSVNGGNPEPTSSPTVTPINTASPVSPPPPPPPPSVQNTPSASPPPPVAPATTTTPSPPHEVPTTTINAVVPVTTSNRVSTPLSSSTFATRTYLPPIQCTPPDCRRGSSVTAESATATPINIARIVGPAVGGAVVGTALICLLIGWIWFRRRRHLYNGVPTGKEAAREITSGGRVRFELPARRWWWGRV